MCVPLMLTRHVMQGLATLTTNPVLTDVLGGLAASATAFASVERMLLWNMRNATVEPFGETVQQVFARISALRDSLDGPQVRMLALQEGMHSTALYPSLVSGAYTSAEC